MKNLKFRKVIAIFLMLLFIVPFIPKQAFAATIGEQLLEPEVGWRRIDDSKDPESSNITFTGSWQALTSSWSSYDITAHQTNTVSNIVKFNFTGDKLRIIGIISTVDYTTNAFVKIDGIDSGSFSQRSTSVVAQSINYEKVGLENKEHSVEISFTNGYLLIDAIDIDVNGTIKAHNSNPVTLSAPTNLTAIQNNSQVNLSWYSVVDATGYNVKRSTTPGGPYTTIATNITTTTYTDTSVENNTTYYYVVSALNGDIESPNSNEVSVSVVIDSSRVLLTITMVNGAIKEYDLSSTELTNFINWYDSKANGTGKAYYKFTRTYPTQPTKVKYEYIVFDKINYFEVTTY